MPLDNWIPRDKALKKEQVASNECIYQENTDSTNFVSQFLPWSARYFSLYSAHSSDVYMYVVS